MQAKDSINLVRLRQRDLDSGLPVIWDAKYKFFHTAHCAKNIIFIEGIDRQSDHLNKEPRYLYLTIFVLKYLTLPLIQ